MGRSKTKGKKLTLTNQDDVGSGEEEKILTQKRRGRPLKSLIKDDMEEDNEGQRLEDESSDDTTKNVNLNGKKRKRNGQVKEKANVVKDDKENGNDTKLSTEESNKSNGFRHSRSRRKNTPRRAAEAVVECN